MKKISTFFLMCLSLSVSAQKYDVKNIPDSILKNANAVIRDEKTAFSIKSAEKAEEKHFFVVTVLNKNADHFADLGIAYDKSTKISNIHAILYDAKGNKLKEYKSNDFADKSLISNSSIYEDSRGKFLNILYPDYPYTIEFSYETNYDGLLSYPSWTPNLDFSVSVEKSSYSITYPDDLEIRYKVNKIQTPEIKNVNHFNAINFTTENLKAIKEEPLSIGLSKVMPWAWFGPTKFKYEGFEGDLSSWNTFGTWLYNLSASQNSLPQNIKTEVHLLTDTVKSAKEKTKVLYHYLQSKTRYVSIQLGIGGLQPFAAEKVATNNYGDCKALSNYMLSLLKEAGINAHLVVVGANPKGGLNKNFASASQANHMILCVPLVKDTVWLECTSQRSPFNYLGSFTEGRNVLLVTPEGGKIVTTPYNPSQKNLQKRNILVDIDTLYNAKLHVETSYNGEQFEDMEGQLYRQEKEKKDFLLNSLQTSNNQISSYKYVQKSKDIPELKETLELALEKIIVNGGSNKFLTLNLLNKRSYIPEISENRVTDFKIGMNYCDEDEVVFVLPKNLKVSFVPKPIEIKTEFGTYKAYITLNDDKLLYKREQVMFKNTYPPEKFTDLVNFYKAIYKADKQKAILVQN